MATSHLHAVYHSEPKGPQTPDETRRTKRRTEPRRTLNAGPGPRPPSVPPDSGKADGTLLVLPAGEEDALMPSLLTISGVMATGHHCGRRRQGRLREDLPDLLEGRTEPGRFLDRVVALAVPDG